MKNRQEPPFPATFWPHALLQMLVFVVYMLVLEPLGVFPGMRLLLGELEAAVGWGLPFVVWLVFIFLVVEQLIRLTQRWAAMAFPFKLAAHVFVQILMVVPMMFIAFVVLQCVLFFMAVGHYPLTRGPVWFEQGFWLTIEAELPLMVLIAVGEVLRHAVYRGWIMKWHHERGLRLLPEVEQP